MKLKVYASDQKMDLSVSELKLENQIIKPDSSLKKEIIKNPATTFYVRVEGKTLSGLELRDGDFLLVDKSIEPTSNNMVLAVSEGEFVLKRITKYDNKIFIVPENNNSKPIEVTPTMDFTVWGVVTYIIQKVT